MTCKKTSIKFDNNNNNNNNLIIDKALFTYNDEKRWMIIPAW
jgi:hypothetical protein